jgi:hypothetical protein
MTPASSSECMAHAPLVQAPSWLHRAARHLIRTTGAGMAVLLAWWRPPAARAQAGQEPQAVDLGSLVQLSDAVLRDIGVPDGLRAEAAQRREQAELLRQLDLHRGDTGLTRW